MCSLALLALPSMALADATVQVILKDKAGKPAAGEVSLVDGDGKTVASCSAGDDGRCEMSAVPGGSYKVHVKPKQGDEPKPHSAMIPPAGKATLHVSTGS
jgi:hypothetical protein